MSNYYFFFDPGNLEAIARWRRMDIHGNVFSEYRGITENYLTEDIKDSIVSFMKDNSLRGIKGITYIDRDIAEEIQMDMPCGCNILTDIMDKSSCDSMFMVKFIRGAG